MKYWHFAFDSLDYQDDVIDGLQMLKSAGLDIRHRANWYVYMDSDDDWESARERCRILRDMDALPYIMVNRDAPRTQRMTDLKRWTRPHLFFTTDYEDYARSNHARMTDSMVIQRQATLDRLETHSKPLEGVDTE